MFLFSEVRFFFHDYISDVRNKSEDTYMYTYMEITSYVFSISMYRNYMYVQNYKTIYIISYFLD